MCKLLLKSELNRRRARKPASQARVKKRVLDLNLWLQNFALYVGMLVPQSRELMAYLINTFKAS